MASVRVRIPTLLAQVTGGGREMEVEGETVGGVLEGLFALHPELRVHLFDETGEIRRHVSVFHREKRMTADRLAGPVADGEEVVVLQAVSGG